MSFKGNVELSARQFFYSDAEPDNSKDGRSLENPKKTIQAAIDAAVALSPGFGNEVRIKEAQGGAYIGDVVFGDSVFFEGTLTSIVGSGSVACTLASFASFDAQAVVNFNNDSIVLKIDGLTGPSPRVTAVQALGLRVVCLDITGSCDRVFHNNLEMVLAQNDCIGVRCDASSPTPIDLNYETVALNGDNCTFIEWNQPGALDVGVIQVSTVEETGSGGLSIHTLPTNLGSVVVTAGIISSNVLAEGGGLVLDAHVLNADTHVKTGAMVTYKSIGVLLGDILVDSGGQLNIENPLHTTGTITNNGIINGIINGVRFGNRIITSAIGVGEMNSNTNATVITDGSYTAIDVTGLVENAVSEGISLTTAVNGVFTYTVDRDITGQLFAAISAIKSGSRENYRFAVSVNGAVPVFASAAFAPMEVKNTKVQATLLGPVSLTQGDTIQVMVAGDGTDDALIITDIVINITEV